MELSYDYNVPRLQCLGSRRLGPLQLLDRGFTLPRNEEITKVHLLFCAHLYQPTQIDFLHSGQIVQNKV